MAGSGHPPSGGRLASSFSWQARGSLELMRLHVDALFTRDDEGRLVRVNEPDGAVAPRLFVGGCPEGVRAWYRNDLEPAMVRDLSELCDALPFGLGFGSRGAAVEAPFVRRLEESSPVTRTWVGPAFRFPEKIPDSGSTVPITVENASLLAARFRDWSDDVGGGRPFVAVVEGGEAVSICCSVRVTERAHEAGVETHPDFRGRGYAVRAVAGWASQVRERGAVPLYSTAWTNHASQAVARKLGLVQFSEDIHLT